MSKIQELLETLEPQQLGAAEHKELLEQARAELKVLIAACEKWRLGQATPNNTMLRIIRTLTDA